eukprot:3824982-Rhodomonas_salina.5
MLDRFVPACFTVICISPVCSRNLSVLSRAMIRLGSEFQVDLAHAWHVSRWDPGDDSVKAISVNTSSRQPSCSGY